MVVIARPITTYTCLTFDCYGTLVDWESGIYRALSPLTSRLPASHPLKDDRSALLRAFSVHEGIVQSEQPRALYPAVLAAAYDALARELGVHATEQEGAAFGAGIGDWPVYPDTVDALKRLREHFKLVILSNVDRASFGKTLEKQLTGIEFDAVYTAEEIGSYKPDPRNFRYLVEHCARDLDVPREGIIHTAQSLKHDHVPATEAGLACAWIDRGADGGSVMGGDAAEFGERVSYRWRFGSMGDMADEVERADARAR